LVPLFVEQLLNSQAAARLGAGLWAMPDDAERIVGTLRGMLSTNQYRQGAEAYAAQYARFAPGQQVPEIVDRLESHLQRR
jgi:UDP:flavonoid glycosyltransferase YjiC (YdhE family)